jgi:hypothetical protein
MGSMRLLWGWHRPIHLRLIIATLTTQRKLHNAAQPANEHANFMIAHWTESRRRREIAIEQPFFLLLCPNSKGLLHR